MTRAAVIIPAFNEEALIASCIQSLLRQPYKDFSLYIVDDASTDNTRKIVAEFAEKHPQLVHLKDYGKVGPGRARNLVARDVDSEFLVFMDADCEATSSWLEELLKGFTSDDVASTGGPHIAPPTSSLFQKRVENFFRLTAPSTDFYKTHSRGIVETSHNPLCNVAYRRKDFIDVRGFREDLWPGEDVEIDLKLRKKMKRITYNPAAIVFHHRPENIHNFKKVMHAYGRAQGKLVRERGAERKIQMLGISILGLQAGLLIAAIFIGGLWTLACAIAALILFYKARPSWPSRWGIWINSAQWFNGFVEGLITKRSLPPGYSENRKPVF